MTRDDKGRFLKGNTGNPRGRLPKERELKFYEIMLSSVSDADWKEIVDTSVKLAKRGDPVARKWLSDYLIGPPVERKEITGADGGSLKIEIVDVDPQPES